MGGQDSVVRGDEGSGTDDRMTQTEIDMERGAGRRVVMGGWWRWREEAEGGVDVSQCRRVKT